MAEYPPACRVCLAIDVDLLSIANTPLQVVFERLTKTPLYTTDMRPLSACYMCYALLRKSYKLMVTSHTAENLLHEIVKNYNKVTKRSISRIDRRGNKLCVPMVISIPECIDSIPRAPAIAAPAPTNPSSRVGPAGNASTAPEIKTEKQDSDNEAEHVFEDKEVPAPNPSVPPLAVGPTGTANPTPEVKTEKDESDSENEYEFMETDAPLSPPSMEVPTTFVAVPMETEKKTVEQPVVKIELCWEEPGMSADKPENPDATADGPVGGPKTMRLAIPRLPGEKLYKCTVCNHQSKYKHVLNNHLRTHTGEKPYICHICERKFSVQVNLKTHLKTHTSEKPFACVLCPSEFKRLHQLKRHMQIHTGEKPFECIVCNRRFTRKHHLKRHLTVHSGEKLFECNVCQWRFSCRGYLKRHLRTHNDEKLYKCDICKSEFRIKATLRIHFMANNGDKVFKCKKCKRKCHYKTPKGKKMCKKCYVKTNK